MPRPKPPEKLLERCVRLTDAQWAELHRRGGVSWLRADLGGSHSLEQWRMERNQGIKDAHSRGDKPLVLANQYGLHISHVHRILKAP